MATLKGKITSSALVVYLFVGAGDAGASQRPASLPASVRAALRSNAEQISGLYIRGYHSRKVLGDSKIILENLGTLESEADFTEPLLFELRLDGNRLHEQLRRSPTNSSTDSGVNEFSFDSERFFAGSADPTSGNPGALVIHSPETLTADEQAFRSFGRLFQLTYLHAAGFEGPQSSLQLGKPIHSMVLGKIEQGVLLSFGLVEFEGREVYEVEVSFPDPWASTNESNIESDPNFMTLGKSRDLQRRIEKIRRSLVGSNRIMRFLLDPTMNYAVTSIREVRADSDEVMFVTRNSDFIELEKDLWLPQVCEVTSHAYETRPDFSTKSPAYITTIAAEEILRRDFEKEDFQVFFDYPGASVENHAHESAHPGNPFSYQVPGSIEEIDGKFGGRSRRLLIGLNVVILVGLLLLFLVRRSRSSTA